MPGKSSDSRALQLIGLAVAAVAVVGTTVFGWEFGQPDSAAPLAIAAVCVAIVAINWLR
ncbi:multidrug transporter [Halolamina sediminis]|uniref:multidrug transporter n=1 Tax=Halolamina sediminis TaxID=1480675 RepID=UPI0012AB81C6|nr:multidrug transporter [Halolamina sediminis]